MRVFVHEGERKKELEKLCLRERGGRRGKCVVWMYTYECVCVSVFGRERERESE